MLCAAWIKVGFTYFGNVGIFVPGLVVPALFVLGIDRLVAMGPRRLDGELAPYSPAPARNARSQRLLRIGTALAIATMGAGSILSPSRLTWSVELTS